MFWPNFVQFEHYVLADGFSVDAVRSMEGVPNSNRTLVESLVNTFDIGDFFTGNQQEEWSPLVRHRVVSIGQTLVQVYEAKLKREFPDRAFKVNLLDVLDENEDQGDAVLLASLTPVWRGNSGPPISQGSYWVPGW